MLTDNGKELHAAMAQETISLVNLVSVKEYKNVFPLHSTGILPTSDPKRTSAIL